MEETILRLASFNTLKLKMISMTDCDLKESDFSEADLSEAKITGCDLENAVFDRTKLIKTDFRNSYNYTIDPEVNKLNQAKFSLAEVPGLLRKYNISIE